MGRNSLRVNQVDVIQDWDNVMVFRILDPNGYLCRAYLTSEEAVELGTWLVNAAYPFTTNKKKKAVDTDHIDVV